MIRKSIAPYLVERLLYFKKGHEKINEVKDLFAHPWEDQKIKISNFQFKFHYELISNEIGKLNIVISTSDEEAKNRLKNNFEDNSHISNVKYGNLIVKSIKPLEKKVKESSYLIKTELTSINEKRTFESVFEYFVKPLVLKK
jgi:hypothetical protein